jgi:inner membrane protein
LLEFQNGVNTLDSKKVENLINEKASIMTGRESLKFWILSIACSILPDADVIGYRWLYIPSYHFFGHRGFFHSPFFAGLLSILIVCTFNRYFVENETK